MQKRFAQLVLGRCRRFNAATAFGLMLVPWLAARIHGRHAHDVPRGAQAGCHAPADRRPTAGPHAPTHRHLDSGAPCLSCQYLSAAKGMTWAPVRPMADECHVPHRDCMLVSTPPRTPMAFRSRGPPLV